MYALGFLLRGLALGFAIAAPVGPIGVLCIRRTLAFGRVIGFVSGLGAATADMCYGAVAAFGLTAVSTLLLRQRLWVHLIGALFLAYLGIKTLLARPASAAALARGGRHGLAGAYSSTLALTLTNPATILSFAAVFAGIGLASAGGASMAALTVAGVFCGSTLWWLLLSGGVGLLRERVTPGALRWVNRLSGAILLAFAVAAVLTAGGVSPRRPCRLRAWQGRAATGRPYAGPGGHRPPLRTMATSNGFPRGRVRRRCL